MTSEACALLMGGSAVDMAEAAFYVRNSTPLLRINEARRTNLLLRRDALLAAQSTRVSAGITIAPPHFVDMRSLAGYMVALDHKPELVRMQAFLLREKLREQMRDMRSATAMDLSGDPHSATGEDAAPTRVPVCYRRRALRSGAEY